MESNTLSIKYEIEFAHEKNEFRYGRCKWYSFSFRYDNNVRF